MKFLDSLFKSDTGSAYENDSRLIHCVEKLNDSEDGVFVNIMNDLGTYIDRVGTDEEKLRQMAYAYARRMVAAGLCAQGIWGQEEFDYTYNLFKAFQQSTGQTVEFQEKAAAQAIELIESYDPRLTKELQMALTSLMMHDASQAKKSGTYFSVDNLLEIIQKSL